MIMGVQICTPYVFPADVKRVLLGKMAALAVWISGSGCRFNALDENHLDTGPLPLKSTPVPVLPPLSRSVLMPC